MKVLITATPMLGMIDAFTSRFKDKDIQIYCPEVIQAMSEDDLLMLVPEYDGWIIGDDPANRRVFEAGKRGKLRAAVKWGVGVDNIDFEAARDFAIPVTNTPNMFGGEVSDVVMSYITSLARRTYLVDREVKAGMWPKPRGISLAGKTVGLVGYGNVGRAISKRALAAEMRLIVYTRHGSPAPDNPFPEVEFARWPHRVAECDFIVLACSLNKQNWHMVNEHVLSLVRPGVRIVNVARGALIDEQALVAALRIGVVHSVALDVYEVEPLPPASPLKNFEQCILGSHNASNTSDAVVRTSLRAIELLFESLGLQS